MCGAEAGPLDSLLNALAARCHPVAGDTLELGFVSSLALQNLSVEYFGQPYVRPNPPPPRLRAADIERGAFFCSAHAGYAPWEGVNALDAAFVAYAGISALRQQIRPEQRVHGVISGRDWTPNGSFPFTFTFSYHRRHRVLLPRLTSGIEQRDKKIKIKKRGEGRGAEVQATLIFYFYYLAHAAVIPDYAKMSWSVRADAWPALEPLRERVVSCLEYVRALSFRLKISINN